MRRDFGRLQGRPVPLSAIVAVWLAMGLLVGGFSPSAQARWPAPTTSIERSAQVELAEVALIELPPEGQRMHALIHAGGPFKYDKDGVVFGNRERILPRQPRGYYREYTVRTPGVRDRGARRIVCGGQPRQPDACFYTDDHYASFRRIRP